MKNKIEIEIEECIEADLIDAIREQANYIERCILDVCGSHQENVSDSFKKAYKEGCKTRIGALLNLANFLETRLPP